MNSEFGDGDSTPVQATAAPDVFADFRLDLTQIDRQGRDYDPSEWLAVPLEKINRAFHGSWRSGTSRRWRRTARGPAVMGVV
ncbi:hypothetical protein [Paraoerskovia marina]|uniref:hypothetical protein n=1 Tax=Paraoerskovia marina TaxID=545619 RepID=UPI0012FB4CAB|nr:hypothetical protein [Paraoerskovia marina]